MSHETSKLAVVANTEKMDRSLGKGLRKALRTAGHEDVLWLPIEKGSAAKKATKRAMSQGATTVIACGGDGTVRAAAEAAVGSDVTLAVVPAGTANLFATSFDIPNDPAEVVALIGKHRRTIDTGTCNGMTFAVMAGSGFDAAMIDAADDSKERLGTLAYVRAGVREARSREPFEMTVKVDGKLFFEGSATCVLVGNIGTLKGGLEAFPDASLTDGLLDIGVITAAGLRDWAGLITAAVRRKQHASGNVHIGQGAEIAVKFDGKHRFELDGGMKGRTKRLDFTAVPQSLSVWAPVPTG